MNSEYQSALDELQDSVALFDDQLRLVTFCNGVMADGREYYAYIHLKASKLLEIQQAQKQGKNIALIDYGEIIIAGEGLNPPAEISQKLEAEYEISEIL